MSAAGKKQRLSAEECRQRLIAVGVAALTEQGLSVGLDAVSLEQAVRDAQVPRSSAYAAWSADGDHTPQELFQHAVLMRTIADRRETNEALHAELAKMMDEIPEGMDRSQLLREMIKRLSTLNLQTVIDSRSWQVVFAMRSILHTANSSSLLDDELREWIGSSEQTLRNETIETLYKPMAEFFGLRPRPAYGDKAYHLVEIASSSLSEGLSMRAKLPAGEYLFEQPHPEVPGEDWSLLALLFERIVDTFFEEIPDD